eukprot:15482491-Alexandrium_andersonii.AAC.1
MAHSCPNAARASPSWPWSGARRSRPNSRPGRARRRPAGPGGRAAQPRGGAEAARLFAGGAQRAGHRAVRRD